MHFTIFQEIFQFVSRFKTIKISELVEITLAITIINTSKLVFCLLGIFLKNQTPELIVILMIMS